MLAPFSYCFGNTVMCDKTVVSFIASLFFYRGPVTVFGGIRAVIINTIKGFSRWLHAHIGKKCFKGVLPPFAYGNASFAVFWIGPVKRVEASRLHPNPGVVGGAYAFGGGVPVFGAASGDSFSFYATTRADTVSSFKRRSLNQSLISARASTMPSRLPRARIRTSLYHGPTPKMLAGQVNQ